MNINIAAPDYVRYGGSAWSSTAGGNQVEVFNTVDATGEAVLANFYAPSGHYDLDFHFLRNSNAAIIDVEIDGVVVATYDLYAPTPAVYKQSINDFVLVDGDHYIKITITGKNGASSAHTAYVGFTTIRSR